MQLMHGLLLSFLLLLSGGPAYEQEIPVLCTPLPEKPIMISFDDNNEEHFTNAAPILTAAGFKGVFFIMTITIGKPGYMTALQIKQLAAEGHGIENHTLNHQNVRHLLTSDWKAQVCQPRQTLEKITGKPVLYFAYPYGAWNEEAIVQLKKLGIKAAFQLSDKKNAQEPLHTIRRLMVPGTWSAKALNQQIKAGFK